MYMYPADNLVFVLKGLVMARRTKGTIPEALERTPSVDDPDEPDILPPHEGPIVPISLRLPKGLLDRLDWLAEASGYSRTDVIAHVLRWGCSRLEKTYGTREAPRNEPKAKRAAHKSP
jgi:hypothetical protein